MKTYEVAIYKTVRLNVRVEADDEDKAMDVAMDNFCDGAYDGMWDDAETSKVGAYDPWEVEDENQGN